MSEKKGPFDDFMVAANEALISAEQFAGSMIPLLRATTKLGGISIALRILKEWPKWKPLIEAAGKVDKAVAIEHFHIQVCPEWEDGKRERIRVGVLAGCPKCVVIDDLLEALPDKEEK